MADKALFNQVLSNPAAYDIATLGELIQQYPSAQSLRIVYAQRQFENGVKDPFGSTWLYTNNTGWLFEQVTLPPQVETDVADATDGHTDTSYYIGEQPLAVIDEQETIAHLAQEEPVANAEQMPLAFEIDDPEAQAADEILQAAETQPADASTAEEDKQPVTTEEDSAGGAPEAAPMVQEEDSLLPDHPIATDYLAYEEFTETPAIGENESHEIVPVGQATPHEKVSLYDDDHMPYSFLWWLNKTRLEHAHTYQPFTSKKDTEASAESADDVRVLDQQIRENIFHLQSPEEKLSEPYKAKTVSFEVPRKIDPVIERFIKEDPQIKPPKPEKINLENKARQSAEDQLNLVTETLAKIYEDQGLYPKAIAIYKKLSLKYPEKSAYFAALITTLENKLT